MIIETLRTLTQVTVSLLTLEAELRENKKIAHKKLVWTSEYKFLPTVTLEHTAFNAQGKCRVLVFADLVETF